MKNQSRFAALVAIGSLLASAQAQDPILFAEAGGVSLWVTPAPSPGEGFSAANITATTHPGAKIVTIEGLKIEGVHQVFGSFTPPASNEGFENAAGPLFHEAWGPFDSHLNFSRSSIAGGVYTLVETNDMSLGDGGLPPAASTAVAQTGIGSIGFANPTDAFFFETPFQTDNIPLAYVVLSNTSFAFTAGFLGDGIVNSGEAGGAFFDRVSPLVCHDCPPDPCHDNSATDVCFSFNRDAEGLELLGNAKLVGSGGVDGGGYLSVTDALNSQNGKVIFPDVGGGGQFVIGGRTGGANSNHHIDNLEASIDDGIISMSVWLRVGDDTGGNNPADGFSFNWVQPNDPALSADTAGWVADPNCPGCPEEGTETGISIDFDEWQSGDPPANDSEYAGPDHKDVVGISLRANGTVIGQASLPILNGALDDPESLQTGPNIAELGWAQLTINAPADASAANLDNVVVTWKGKRVEFVPEPASGLMALMSLLGVGMLRRRAG